VNIIHNLTAKPFAKLAAAYNSVRDSVASVFAAPQLASVLA